MLWVVMARSAQQPGLGTVKAQRTFLGSDIADMKHREKQFLVSSAGNTQTGGNIIEIGRHWHRLLLTGKL